MQHLDEENIINSVSPEKDVDGFHPLNMGNLAMSGREPFFVPCAPMGCIELLLRHGVEISGKRAVVIGRSKIVGLPTSLLLQVVNVYVVAEKNVSISKCLIYCPSSRGTMQQSAWYMHSQRTQNR